MNQTIVGTADQLGGSTDVVEISVQKQLAALVAGMELDLEARRKDLVTMEAMLADKKQLCSALPETLPLAPQKITIGSNVYKADAQLGFEVTSYDDVIRLLDALPGVPVLLIKAGCTTFVPEERYIQKEGQQAKLVPVGEIVYRLSHWVRELQEEYTWWTRLGDRLVHVVAKTKKGCAINAQVRSSSKVLNLQGTIHKVTWTYQNLPAGELMQWAGGRNPGEVIPISVHLERGVSFGEAVARPMTASCTINTHRCDC